MDYNELQRQLAAQESYHDAIAAGNYAKAQALVEERDRIVAAYHAANQPPPPPPPSPPEPSLAPAPVTAPAPAPDPPPPPPPVKIPSRDVLNFTRNNISATGITTLLFENIGGVEISILTRRDTVEGQNPYYSLISNLSTIKSQYDPTQLIAKQKSSQTIFDVFAIKLNTKIPGDVYLKQKNLENFFYIAQNGDLIIELDNILQDENIQLEIASGGTIRVVNES
jgi:hypothetical protein